MSFAAPLFFWHKRQVSVWVILLLDTNLHSIVCSPFPWEIYLFSTGWPFCHASIFTNRVSASSFQLSIRWAPLNSLSSRATDLFLTTAYHLLYLLDMSMLLLDDPTVEFNLLRIKFMRVCDNWLFFCIFASCERKAGGSSVDPLWSVGEIREETKASLLDFLEYGRFWASQVCPTFCLNCASSVQKYGRVLCYWLIDWGYVNDYFLVAEVLGSAILSFSMEFESSLSICSEPSPAALTLLLVSPSRMCLSITWPSFPSCWTVF